ncbi:MAG TPA: hypothetical protein VFD14_02620, partial [Clostridia bacterium]|nr:hypothetical protein [Clostridia bacterium]
MIRQCERRLHRHIARLDEIIHELWNPDSMSDGYAPLIEPTEPCEFCRDPDDLIVARYKPRKPGDPDPMMVAVEALDPELCPMC